MLKRLVELSHRGSRLSSHLIWLEVRKSLLSDVCRRSSVLGSLHLSWLLHVIGLHLVHCLWLVDLSLRLLLNLVLSSTWLHISSDLGASGSHALGLYSARGSLLGEALGRGLRGRMHDTHSSARLLTLHCGGTSSATLLVMLIASVAAINCDAGSDHACLGSVGLVHHVCCLVDRLLSCCSLGPRCSWLLHSYLTHSSCDVLCLSHLLLLLHPLFDFFLAFTALGILHLALLLALIVLNAALDVVLKLAAKRNG